MSVYIIGILSVFLLGFHLVTAKCKVIHHWYVHICVDVSNVLFLLFVEMYKEALHSFTQSTEA